MFLSKWKKIKVRILNHLNSKIVAAKHLDKLGNNIMYISEKRYGGKTNFYKKKGESSFKHD